MNEAIILQLVRLSLTAGWMILILLALRPLLKRAPRNFSCLLWALVGVRLALPFSFQSRVSLVPQAAASPLRLVDALPAYQQEQVMHAALPAAQAAQAEPAAWMALTPIVWMAGIAAMALYALIAYLRLHRRIRISAPAGDGVYWCDDIRSPFVLGLLRPRIYLPSDLEPSLADSVLVHERAHLRRGDQLWKPLGYLLLCVYWFNPLCWLAYCLFCRDLEQACDEAAVRHMTAHEKRTYSAALLSCSLPRSAVSACPLAFAEVGVKQRIKGILNYRKPKFWVLLLTAVLCAALAAGLLTDPVKAEVSGQQDNRTYILPHAAVLHSNPSENAAVVGTLDENTDVLMSVWEKERNGSGSWAFVKSALASGWLDCTPEEAALALFNGYAAACADPTPDRAETYRYFASEYDREFFRDYYVPITGWSATGVTTLADRLWCITYADEILGTDYAFVGELEERLYVFANVHDLPESWQAQLDVSQYELEDAMYLSEGFKECAIAIKRLLQFAEPVRVEVHTAASWQPMETDWTLDFTDTVCSTDTWRFTDAPQRGNPACRITLHAADGSTARIWDLDGTVLITHPDGSQECCQSGFSGQELTGMLYPWAAALAAKG